MAYSKHNAEKKYMQTFSQKSRDKRTLRGCNRNFKVCVRAIVSGCKLDSLSVEQGPVVVKNVMKFEFHKRGIFCASEWLVVF